jgi:hypothetical protein
MIHNVYRKGNLSPTYLENQLPDLHISVESHEFYLHISAALSNTFAHHVLLSDFNIHHPTWGGASQRPDYSYQLPLSLRELHDQSLLLPRETITFKRHNAQRTINLVFPSSSLSHTLTVGCSREILDHGSDYYTIESFFLFSLHTTLHVPKPLWLMADKAALLLRARKLNKLSRLFENCKEIVAGVDRLVRGMKEAIAQHILLLSQPLYLSPGKLVSSLSLCEMQEGQ